MQAGGSPRIDAFASVQVKHPFTVVSEQVAHVGSQMVQCITSPTATNPIRHVQLAGPTIALVFAPHERQFEEAPAEQVKQSEWQGWQLSAVPQVPGSQSQVQGAAADRLARGLQLSQSLASCPEHVKQVKSQGPQVPTVGAGVNPGSQKQEVPNKEASGRQLLQLEDDPAKQLSQRGLQPRQLDELGQG